MENKTKTEKPAEHIQCWWCGWGFNTKTNAGHSPQCPYHGVKNDGSYAMQAATNRAMGRT